MKDRRDIMAPAEDALNINTADIPADRFMSPAQHTNTVQQLEESERVEIQEPMFESDQPQGGGGGGGGGPDPTDTEEAIAKLEAEIERAAMEVIDDGKTEEERENERRRQAAIKGGKDTYRPVGSKERISVNEVPYLDSLSESLSEISFFDENGEFIADPAERFVTGFMGTNFLK